MRPVVGVLAVQGAFAEMSQAFRRVGAETFELRSAGDLERPFDALALPGGESTVQGKLLHKTGMFEPLAARMSDGLPVFATCAGLILLAREIENDPTRWFAVLPVTVRRNAYGRQLGSFATTGRVDGDENVPMTFIRAPSIVSVGDGVEVLSTFNGAPTGVRYDNITALAWHPELTADGRVVAHFLSRFLSSFASAQLAFESSTSIML